MTNPKSSFNLTPLIFKVFFQARNMKIKLPELSVAAPFGLLVPGNQLL